MGIRDVIITLKWHPMTVMVHGMLGLHNTRHREAQGTERFRLADYVTNGSSWTGSSLMSPSRWGTREFDQVTKWQNGRPDSITRNTLKPCMQACQCTIVLSVHLWCTPVPYSMQLLVVSTRMGQRQDSCAVLICKATEVFASTAINRFEPCNPKFRATGSHNLFDLSLSALPEISNIHKCQSHEKNPHFCEQLCAAMNFTDDTMVELGRVLWSLNVSNSLFGSSHFK